MGMTPYKMVYGKACQLPESLNFDFKAAGEKRLLDIHALDELRSEAYENARIFKEKVKRWHDRKKENKEFKPGDKVLLYNSRFKLFPGKLRSKWEGPYDVDEAYPSGAVKLKGPTSSWIVNGQRLKHYRADEVDTVEVIHVITAEEMIQLRYAERGAQ